MELNLSPRPIFVEHWRSDSFAVLSFPFLVDTVFLHTRGPGLITQNTRTFVSDILLLYCKSVKAKCSFRAALLCRDERGKKQREEKEKTRAEGKEDRKGVGLEPRGKSGNGCDRHTPFS